MDEFNNRMNVQRRVLSIINSNNSSGEELFGLSEHAISRWASNHAIMPDSLEVKLLVKISEKMSFLATKSQEQITQDYLNLSDAVEGLIQELITMRASARV